MKKCSFKNILVNFVEKVWCFWWKFVQIWVYVLVWLWMKFLLHPWCIFFLWFEMYIWFTFSSNNSFLPKTALTCPPTRPTYIRLIRECKTVRNGSTFFLVRLVWIGPFGFEFDRPQPLSSPTLEMLLLLYQMKLTGLAENENKVYLNLTKWFFGSYFCNRWIWKVWEKVKVKSTLGWPRDFLNPSFVSDEIVSVVESGSQVYLKAIQWFMDPTLKWVLGMFHIFRDS